MLTVEYDPDNGTVVPDNQVRSYAKMIIDSYHALSDKAFAITVGAEIMLQPFKIAAMKGDIEMQVKFGDVLIPVKDGRLTFYPIGFPDVNCDLLIELI